MKKFIVIRGRRTIVGSINCDYKISDVIILNPSFDFEDQMREYVNHIFSDEKVNFNKDDISCRRKNIVLDDGRIFAERIKVFDHEDNSYFGFIPVEVFDFSDSLLNQPVKQKQPEL